MTFEYRTYFDEVKQLDSGKLSIEDFILNLFGKLDRSAIIAGWVIYMEDGGKKHTFEEFKQLLHEVSGE